MVYAGADLVGYTTQTKKAFMVWQLFIVLVIDFTYAYFLCVCAAYKERIDGGKDSGLGFDIPVPEVPMPPMPGKDDDKPEEDKPEEDKPEEDKPEEEMMEAAEGE